MRLRWQRGDTLIEVTIALAILTMVLFGAYTVSNKAFSVGQTANERNVILGASEQQLEALQSFHDSHTWDQFNKGGIDTNPDGSHTAFTGVVNAMNQSCPPNPDGTIPYSFHMTMAGNGQWYPQACGTGCSVGIQNATCHFAFCSTGVINPSAVPGASCVHPGDPDTNPEETFHMYYQVGAINSLAGRNGSNLERGEIDLKLADLTGLVAP